MKRFKLGSRILACVLSIVMILGTCPTAFATEMVSPDPIKYVSLGDSMTNGYGLPGYNGNNGVYDYGNASYANLFAQWLVDEGYAENVEHEQLAMSAMRAEDLHWLLELDYSDGEAVAVSDMSSWDEARWNSKFTTGDYWTWHEIAHDYRAAVAATYILAEQGNSGARDALASNPNARYYNDGEAGLVAEVYQNAVKEADIISLAMGNGNFGVFAFGRIMDAIGFGASGNTPDEVEAAKEAAAMRALVYKVENAICECEPALQAKILELRDILYERVSSVRTSFVGFTDTQWDALLNTVVYTGLSYVLNYAGSIEAILQLNNDAEIILVGLMNTFAEPGAKVDYENIDSLGDLMGAIFEPLNVYIAALPTYMKTVRNGVYKDATFYYAEAPIVECLVDVYETEIRNSESVIRDRFVESIVGTSGNPGMVWGLLKPVVGGMVPGASLENIVLNDIIAYESMDDSEKVAYAAINTNKALSCALYLAFEDAILAASDATVDLNSVMGLGGLNASLFSGVMDKFSDNIGVNGAEYAQTAINSIATIVAERINDQIGTDVIDEVTVAGLIAGTSPLTVTQIVEAMVQDTMLQNEDVAYVVNQHGGLFESLLNCDGSDGYCVPIKTAYNNNVNTYVSRFDAAIEEGRNNVELPCMLLALPETLSTALQETSEVYGLLGLFARCIIGNGLGAHPSAGGHVSLCNALSKTYSEGYTVIDETIKNVTEIIIEYYDEAYAYAYAKADEEGYIDLAAEAIDEAIAVISNIDIEGIEMTEEFKTKLEAELYAVVLTLEEIKAVLAEDKASNVEGLVQSVSALGDDLNTHLTNAGAILAQAGFDIKTLVAPIVDAYVSALVADLKDTIKTEADNLKDIIKAEVENLKGEVAKIGHKHYESNDDSLYVAIGAITKGLGYGKTAYFDLVAQNYGIDKSTDMADVANADLITYQLDASSLIWSALNVDADWDKYINEYLEPAERELVEKIVDETINVLTMDWKNHTDTEITELVEKIKVAILEKLPEDVPYVEDIFDSLIEFLLPYVQNEIIKIEGRVNEEFKLDEKISKLEEINNAIISLDKTTKDYIEKAAFSFVAYAIESAKEIEAIQAINPDATLVVVGMYNPLRGLEVKFGENVIDVEEYFEYVIKASNCYYSLLSLTNKGFAFVDVSEAQTNGFDSSIDVSDSEELITKLGTVLFESASMMNANADGHVYIKDQIVKALTCDYSVCEAIDADYHAIKCSICGAIERIEEHTWDGNTCTGCGYTRVVVPTPTPDPDPTPTPRPSYGGGSATSMLTIKFETNGGSAVASAKVVYGDVLVAPANPTKDGFVFDGWYTDKELTNKYDFSQKVTKSFTLYAKWAVKNPFIDVNKDDWFYDAVMFVYMNGITKGVSETEYAPQGKVTRGQFITMLCRAYKVEEMSGDNFADCGSTWYTGYLAAAKQLGISNGVGDNMFAPEKEITREEMVTLIYNYLKSINKVTEETAELSFADSDSVSEWAKTAVAYAAKNGIVSGKGNNIFDPNGTATRAELAQIFYNMFK